MRASDFLASAQAEVAPPADSTVCANLYPEPGGLLRLPRWAVLSIVTLAALLLCAVATAAVRPNTPRGAAVGYTCDSLTLLTCAAAFWIHRRSATGLLRIRWSIMVAALLAASAAFAECFPDAFGVSSPLLRPFQVILFNIGDALYILAAVLFFSGVARSIVVLDMFQGLLLVVLRYNLTYTRTNSDHFTVNHLLISQMVALFLFLIVLIAGFGAASASEHRFLRFLSWFFGLRFVSWFLSDQVSYTWLHNRYCSLWDAPGPALLIGFALYLIYTAPSPQAAHNVEDTHVRRPSLFVRSLMPSFLALANLVLALFLLRLSMPTAAFAILLTVGLYVARTALLQSHAAQQATTGGSGLALLLMDIDYFKQTNDLLGHLYGDQVLIALARTIEGVAARVPGSHCARFGGDEFALLLPAASHNDACKMAEEVRSNFAAQGFHTGERNVSISVGLHRLDTARDLPLETLISFADAALYSAKMLGRNRVNVHSMQDRTFEVSTPAASIELEHPSERHPYYSSAKSISEPPRSF
jgi:diguanylate cyclase (GGDEF)-like protein